MARLRMSNAVNAIAALTTEERRTLIATLLEKEEAQTLSKSVEPTGPTGATGPAPIGFDKLRPSVSYSNVSKISIALRSRSEFLTVARIAEITGLTKAQVSTAVAKSPLFRMKRKNGLNTYGPA